MNKKVMLTHTAGKTIHHVDTVDNDDTIVIRFTDGTYSTIKAELDLPNYTYAAEEVAKLTYP